MQIASFYTFFQQEIRIQALSWFLSYRLDAEDILLE
jgi:hypothetical protein